MLTTTHYGLNIVEGTDVVNPLVQQNPNYTAIDAAMFANKQGSIGSATELKAGTVHTITRANTDSNYIRFTATSNWVAGDSMIVDSTPVSVYLSDGTVPGDGAYVINTEVFLILNGSRVTILTSSAVQDASTVSFDNSGTNLSSTDVEDAIKEVNTKVDRKIKYYVFTLPAAVVGYHYFSLPFAYPVSISDVTALTVLTGGADYKSYLTKQNYPNANIFSLDASVGLTAGTTMLITL